MNFSGKNRFSWQTMLRCLMVLVCLKAVSFADTVKFDVWTTANGLPQNTVTGITQTPDGYLWISTFDGLARFDGVRFTIFNKGNSRGIINNRFYGIFTDRAGNIWAYTENGILTVYCQGVFTSYETPEGLRELIRNVSEDENNRIVIQTAARQYYFENGNFVALPAEKQRDTSQIYGRNPDSVWTIDEHGVTHDRNGSQTFYPGQFARTISAEQKEIFPAGLLEDSRGALWIPQYENSYLYRLHNGVAQTYSMSEMLGGNDTRHITPLLEDAKGHIWMGVGVLDYVNTSTGLIEFDGAKFHHHRDVKGFWSGGFVDREGNTWMRGGGNGLMRLQDQIITTLSVKDGLETDEIYPVMQTRAGGGVLVGTTRGVNLYRNGKFSDLSDSITVRSFWENERGELYFSSYGGLARIEKDLTVTRLGETEADGYTDIEDAGDGFLWLAGETGLVKFREDRPAERFTVNDGLPHNHIITLYKDRGGTLWIGTAKGLSQLRDGKFRNFEESDGMPEDVVREIYEDADGTFWIGTYGSGLVRYKNNEFVNFTNAHGLFNNGVFAILEDDRGNFWMSSNRGIYRVAKQQFNDFAAGKIPKIESFSYGESDGMVSTECKAGGIRRRSKHTTGGSGFRRWAAWRLLIRTPKNLTRCRRRS